MVSSFDPASEDLLALVHRVRGSFVGRCVMRFLGMAGIDRCIVLSSQALTALFPLLILVTTLAPVGQEDVVAQTLISKFALEGEAATAVEQLFATPVGATSSTSLFSLFLLLFSGVSFTRRMQTMYRMAWGQEKAGVRSGLFAALGLAAMLVEVLVLYAVRDVVRDFPPDWLWMLPLSVATGTVLWTSIPYLLLNRQVHWRRLLAAGGTAAVGTAVFSIATTVYMPPLISKYTNDFGLFGITIALIGWLLALAGVVVASTAIGAEFDASQDPWVRRLKARFRLVDPDDTQLTDENVESAGLTRNDLALLVRVVKNWLALTTAVWAATAVVPGINVPGGFLTYLGVSFLLGFVNAVLGPLLTLLALPLSLFRLGLCALVINSVLLALTAGISSNLDMAGPGSAVLGALVISVVATVLEFVLAPVGRQSTVSSRHSTPR